MLGRRGHLITPYSRCVANARLYAQNYPGSPEMGSSRKWNQANNLCEAKSGIQVLTRFKPLGFVIEIVRDVIGNWGKP